MKTTLALFLALGTFLLLPADAGAARYDGWYYGNWGGPNYSDGKVGGKAFGSAAPVDDLDRAAREHDRAYATADAAYRIQYWAIAWYLRPVVYKRWEAAYLAADRRLAAAAARLPLLKVKGDGSDTWHGKNVPASKSRREGYRTAIVALAMAGWFKKPTP